MTLQLKIGDYTVTNFIGKGCYGFCYLATNKNGAKFVLKLEKKNAECP
jgi:hypothetical protein